MMDKKLIEALKPIEEEFNVELFTFEEALEFYKSDIESYKIVTNQLLEIAEKGTADEKYKKGIIEGIMQGIDTVDLVFGGRVEEGF